MNFQKWSSFLAHPVKIFGKKIAKRTSFSEVYSFSTWPNLCQCTTVLNADIPHCYIQHVLNATFSVCWMLQHVSSPALGSSTVAWNVFFMTTCTGSTFLNEFSSSSVWQFVGVCDAELLVDYCTSVADVVSIYVQPVVVSSWCHVTVSACSVVGPSQWLVRCPGTHYRTVSASRRVMTTFQTTVSNIHWKHFSLVDIDVLSAVEVFTTLHYINVHLLT